MSATWWCHIMANSTAGMDPKKKAIASSCVKNDVDDPWEAFKFNIIYLFSKTPVYDDLKPQDTKDCTAKATSHREMKAHLGGGATLRLDAVQ